MTASRIGTMAFIAIFELAIVLLDTTLLFGFTFFNDRRTSPAGHAGLVVMLIGDIFSFGLFWWRPRQGGMLLVCVSILALILVMIGATRDGMASLWLTGAVFWGAKGILALVMLKESSTQSSALHSASGS